MESPEMVHHGLITSKVLQFAKKMQWIERENCSLLKLYVEKLNEEIQRLNGAVESKKAKRRSRRSVCVRKISLSSSEDDENDNNDDGNDDKDTDKNDDNEVEELNESEDEAGPCDESGSKNKNDSGEDDDSFNAFLTKVKSTRRNTNVIVSSDEEDGSDDMDDFIDDSEVAPNVNNIWKTPRKSELTYLSSSSDEDQNQDESRNCRRLKIPVANILNSVTAPKAPRGTAAYKREYKKLRDQTVIDLFVLFNESVFDNQLPDDLKILFNNRMTKTAGFCYYYWNRVTNVRSCKVEIAEKVCDNLERLRDTVIHELCHAAAWIINGVKCGHGSYWKLWANKAHKAHPDLPPISRCHQFDIECRFNYKCINPHCGKSYGRHSKSLKKCPDCLGALQLLGKDGVTPLKQREPSKFALFVKGEYQATKYDNPQMSHSEIMKLLGQNFSKLSTRVFQI